MNVTPLRIPDASSIETILADLDPVPVDADLIPCPRRRLPQLRLHLAQVVDDAYWRETPGQ